MQNECAGDLLLFIGAGVEPYGRVPRKYRVSKAIHGSLNRPAIPHVKVLFFILGIFFIEKCRHDSHLLSSLGERSLPLKATEDNLQIGNCLLFSKQQD